MINAQVHPTNSSGTIPQSDAMLSYNYDGTVGSFSKGNLTQRYDHGLETQRFDGDNATDRKILYVEGGEGLCAMIVAGPGASGAWEQVVYSVYKDHLGSLVALTKKEGSTVTVVAEQNFDAWGRRRNPATWEYSSLPVLPDWLYRGYTGHEHVEPFALINMNGRMYDPLNGRMLSADNFVQGGLGSQGFNRFSYAGNNPFKYTDPSGDFVWFVAAAAVSGAYLGGAIAAGKGGLRGADWNPFGGKDGTWSGDWWKGAITGAMIGATVGYGAASIFGGSATQAALATEFGTTLGLSAKKVAITSGSNLFTTVATNKSRGWNSWSSLVAAAAAPFISDLSLITGNADIEATALTEMAANATYGFVDRFTAPTIATAHTSDRIGYSFIGALEGASSFYIYGGILSESGMSLKSASLVFHLTTSLPGFNESLLRGAISPLTLFGTIPFDRWYISQTNRYQSPWNLDRILQFMLTQ